MPYENLQPRLYNYTYIDSFLGTSNIAYPAPVGFSTCNGYNVNGVQMIGRWSPVNSSHLIFDAAVLHVCLGFRIRGGELGVLRVREHPLNVEVHPLTTKSNLSK